ncbi:hypothetical protein VTN96DRAFT_2298 [Rasamsonia emersonii]
MQANNSWRPTEQCQRTSSTIVQTARPTWTQSDEQAACGEREGKEREMARLRKEKAQAAAEATGTFRWGLAGEGGRAAGLGRDVIACARALAQSHAALPPARSIQMIQHGATWRAADLPACLISAWSAATDRLGPSPASVAETRSSCDGAADDASDPGLLCSDQRRLSAGRPYSLYRRYKHRVYWSRRPSIVESIIDVNGWLSRDSHYLISQ